MSSVNIVIRSVKFAKGDIRNVRFVAIRRSVTITCKGKQTLRVVQTENGKFCCFPLGNSDNTFDPVLVGKTPEQAYKRAVREYWGKPLAVAEPSV